jgi:hypothetical protein
MAVWRLRWQIPHAAHAPRAIGPPDLIDVHAGRSRRNGTFARRGEDLPGALGVVKLAGGEGDDKGHARPVSVHAPRVTRTWRLPSARRELLRTDGATERYTPEPLPEARFATPAAIGTDPAREQSPCAEGHLSPASCPATTEFCVGRPELLRGPSGGPGRSDRERARYQAFLRRLSGARFLDLPRCAENARRTSWSREF